MLEAAFKADPDGVVIIEEVDVKFERVIPSLFSLVESEEDNDT